MLKFIDAIKKELRIEILHHLTYCRILRSAIEYNKVEDDNLRHVLMSPHYTHKYYEYGKVGKNICLECTRIYEKFLQGDSH